MSTFVPNENAPNVVWGAEETANTLRKMAESAERGELGCVALRLFNADGTWEDVVFGARDEAEREAALKKLRSGN